MEEMMKKNPDLEAKIKEDTRILNESEERTKRLIPLLTPNEKMKLNDLLDKAERVSVKYSHNIVKVVKKGEVLQKKIDALYDKAEQRLNDER